MTLKSALPRLYPTTIYQRFWAWLLAIFGWSIRGQMPTDPKYVMIVAPHTSNWDWPILFAGSRAIDLPFPYWVAKHTMFWGPLGWFFRQLGGIAINRERSANFVKQVVAEFDRNDQMLLAITPEGTRSKSLCWKSGFYLIASNAHVPIVMVYIDYKHREMGVATPLHLSDDTLEDMETIRRFYAGVQGKHPENQGDVCLRVELTQTEEYPDVNGIAPASEQ